MKKLSSLEYFKAIPSDLSFEINKVLENQKHPFYKETMDDLLAINEDALTDFCSEDDVDLFFHENQDKNLERRKWFLNWQLRKQIANDRRNKLIEDSLGNRPSLYDFNELNGISIDNSNLIDIHEFNAFGIGLLRGDYVYQICPSLPGFNSSYWLSKLIIEESFKKNRNFKIRIDPFVRIHKDEYRSIGYKMWVYGKKLEWERLSMLQQEEFGHWDGGGLSNESIDISDYVWSPLKTEIHFTWEELPKYEYIEERGSRYLHAIFNKKTGFITHCDGALRFYSREEFEKRKNYHIRQAEVRKIGNRIKIFQIDDPIEQSLFINLATAFLVWNQDVLEYFS